jgi:aspartate/methionine/tyrosine aminotransferase
VAERNFIAHDLVFHWVLEWGVKEYIYLLALDESHLNDSLAEATVARLPIDDADKFCAWLLSDFEFEGQTVMMAPASGFYTIDGMGKDEVRIAYVLDKEDLKQALVVLRKALEVYPGKTI